MKRVVEQKESWAGSMLVLVALRTLLQRMQLPPDAEEPGAEGRVTVACVTGLARLRAGDGRAAAEPGAGSGAQTSPGLTPELVAKLQEELNLL